MVGRKGCGLSQTGWAGAGLAEGERTVGEEGGLFMGLARRELGGEATKNCTNYADVAGSVSFKVDDMSDFVHERAY